MRTDLLTALAKRRRMAPGVVCQRPAMSGLRWLVTWWLVCVSHWTPGQGRTLTLPRATSLCDPATEFACMNDNCIPLSKYNNSVNDCQDNSDEAPKPCKKPAYSCLNGNCAFMAWVRDGENDCGDDSDEVKIIGTDCTMIKDCCHCDEYVDNSECNGTCQCRSGFYSNQLGTECIRRVIGDSCWLDPDCFDAFSNSSCILGSCICDVGYYDSDNGTSCVARKVGDNCTVDPECSNVIPNSNCSSEHCACNSGFYHSPDLTSCVLRKVGEVCIAEHQCGGIAHSFCTVQGACACRRGFRVEQKNSYCHIKLIGEACQNHEDCQVAGSHCLKHNCACQLGRHPNETLDYCALRHVGDSCVVDDDCSHSVENSRCLNRKCHCAIGFEYEEDNLFECYDPFAKDVATFSGLIIFVCLLAFLDIFLITALCSKFVIKKIT